MSQELARKRPATIVSISPLPSREVTVYVRPVERGPAPRAWRPDLWPWYVWGPILCAPGVVLVYVLIFLASFIVHKL